jgi:hypothetical protein
MGSLGLQQGQNQVMDVVVDSALPQTAGQSHPHLEVQEEELKII